MVSSYVKFKDEELVNLLAEGSEKAFLNIYHKYKAPLYLHVFRKLQNKEEAKDLVQELFTHLWLKRKELTITDNLSHYLFTAVRNRAFRLLAKKDRNNRHMQSLVESLNAHFDATDYRVRENMLKEMIAKEIDTLPQKRKEVFIMSRIEGLSHKEIAERLELSETTVKKHINNALKVLRKNLGLPVFLLMQEWLK